ncbi:hypothetical protein AAFF_G00010520 [Aldrovandia affinis]|uniref:Inter-alpha-trypsin inhibitor heavy chain family member 6 n=1 Tax=Aldrovandia affinis TaxID=143900 RepID=A0AAD7S6V8_9TELE|nr:hypothetical protein AAFF_G00010520 [Aldrovandia affinis]
MEEVTRSFGLLWIVIFLTAFIQIGFSEEYRARVGTGNNLFLQRAKRQSRPAKLELKVTDFHVRCSVVSRYAATTVQSSVWNTLPVTKEAAFEVDLPSSAFISNFSITSNGKMYVAEVKERSVAKKIYDTAKKRGKTAGLVATKEREVEKFRVAVSVPSGTRLSFSLTYEELLSRRLGQYELVLGLRPGQPVHNLSLEVSVAERSGISFIQVLPLRTSRLLSNTVSGEVVPPPSTQVVQTPCCAQVHYTPTLQQQTTSSPKGLNADFIIQYDVELTDLMGDVQIYDGYFVHYFAPRGLPVVPKDVIFVIDISGSMIGTKIKQTKQAMTTILGDLREGDHFNIITFSDKVHTWKKGRAVQATRQNVREAKDFVKKINAEGWTNINSALLSAAQLVNPPSSSGSTGVRGSACATASLFGLAFGDDADFPLLRRLALENRGVARTVYEDADAALQLKGFYDEVASPLLSDVQLSYLDDQAYDVTRALFPNYFQGSELVVAGRVKPGVQDLKVSLTATDSNHKLRLENDVPTGRPGGNDTAELLSCLSSPDGISSFVRRLWAYFTIKELLQAKLNSTDPLTQRLLGEKATNLSLKYNFVTPVTSLVVVKPDIDEPENGTVSPADVQYGYLTTLLLSASPSSTPQPDSDSGAIEVATLIAATFIPMPGATEAPKLWEAAGLLDVSTVIQVEKKDIDLVKDYDDYDYDYDLSYDSRDISDSYDNSLSSPTSQRIFTSSVDGDPHFVVPIPQSDQNLCFTIDGRANDVLRLLEDPERGIIVDGHLAWAPSKRGFEDRSRTYFDQLTILAAAGGGVVVMVTLDSVVLEGEGREILPTDRPGSVVRQGLRVAVDEHLRCWVELGQGLRFLILFHHYKHPTYLQIDHLGFYVADGQGLSPLTQGLLGQFQHADMEIIQTKVPLGDTGRHAQETEAGHLVEGVLRRGVKRILVTLQEKHLKDTVRKRHLDRCWVVPRAEVDAVLGHPYESYVVDHV